MTIDVRRAYFYALAQRPVFIEIPIEDWEEGDDHRAGKLSLSLYGTRDAAQNWIAEYTGFLESFGFSVGLASPCNFNHRKMELTISVHGDDFTAVGPDESLDWFQARMEGKYEVKCDKLGPKGEAGKKPEIRILNRTIRWCEDGISYEPDQRHAEIIVEAMNVLGAKGAPTPAIAKKDDPAERLSEKEMNRDAATHIRAIAARGNYSAQDRIDLPFAMKSAARYMANPKKATGVRLRGSGNTWPAEAGWCSLRMAGLS